MRELKKERIFKEIKDLDINIRIIEEELNQDKDIIYNVSVGLYESLGEQGEILTLFYETYPTEQEIIKDTRKELKETYKELKEEFCLSSREESYLNILKRLRL
jgi:hypothetical protein